MSPVLIDAGRSEEERDIVHRAVEALVAGKLVALPTETVYGIAALALREKAVERLIAVKGRRPGHPLALAVKGYEEALDYCPDMPPLARRLAQRCWPGPVTLVLDSQRADSLKARLPAAVQAALSPNGLLGFRVPDHRVVHAALRLLPAPLVLSSANRSGEREAVSGGEVAAAFGDEIDLILDDGHCKYGKASSVVRVDGNRVLALREGVLSGASLRRFSSLIVLLVCTGNTCRSPMAQLLLQRQIAERIGCRIEELEQRGVMVMSAGLAAFDGAPAAREAIQVLGERGLDLSHHESRILSEPLVRFADLILAMTRGHREAIVERWPDVAGKTMLLCRDRQDVADPIGGTLQAYAACAAQLERQLAEWAKSEELAAIPEFG